jgi:hypothetical protein
MSFIIQPAAAGSSVQGTASGAVAANKPVVVNADGTFSQAGIAASTTTLSFIATADLVTTTTNSLPLEVYDSTNKKLVRFYNNGFGLYYVVGTNNGSVVTWGTEQSVPTPGSALFDQAGSATFHVASGCIVLTYLEAVSSSIHAIAGTVSGTTITWGSTVQIVNDLGSVSQPFSVYDATNQKVVFVYNASLTGGSCNVISCTAGRVITKGAQVVFDGNSSRFLNGCYDSTNGKVVIYYRPNIAGQKPYYCVGTVSGTTISFGTPTIIYNAAADVPDSSTAASYNASANRVVIIYQDGTNWVLQAGQVSGTTITWGTAVSTALTSISTDQITISYDSTNGKSALFYPNTNVAYRVLGFSLAASVITIGSITTIKASTTTSGLTCVFDSFYNQFVPIYRDAALAGTYDKLGFYGTYNLTSENFIGFSVAAVSTGATVTVSTVGGSDTGQSGLTPGQAYYVQNNGTLSQTPDSPSVYAGLAYAATKILIGN